MSHGVPVYLPDYVGTKLFCLVTEAHVRENGSGAREPVLNKG